MQVSCDFCLAKVKADNINNVNTTMVDRNPGFIYFKPILKIVFGCVVSEMIWKVSNYNFKMN
jgi:hypothetical protein